MDCASLKESFVVSSPASNLSVISNSADDTASMEKEKDSLYEKLQQKLYKANKANELHMKTIDAQCADISDLEKQLILLEKHWSVKFKDLECEHHELKREHVSKVQEQGNLVEKLKQELETAKSQVHLLIKQNVAQQYHEERVTEASIKELEAKIESITLQNEYLSHELQEAKALNDQLTQQAEQATEEISRLSDVAKSKEDQCMALNDHVNDLLEENTCLAQQLASLPTVESSATKGNSLFAEVDDRRRLLENKYGNIAKENEKLKRNLNDKDQEIKTYQIKTFMLLQQQNASFDSTQLKMLEHSVLEYSQQLRELTDLCSTVEKQLLQKHQEFKDREGMQRYVDVLRSENLSFQGQILNLKQKLAEAAQNNTSLHFKIVQYEKKMSQLRSEIAELHKNQLKDCPSNDQGMDKETLYSCSLNEAETSTKKSLDYAQNTSCTVLSKRVTFAEKAPIDSSHGNHQFSKQVPLPNRLDNGDRAVNKGTVVSSVCSSDRTQITSKAVQSHQLTSEELKSRGPQEATCNRKKPFPIIL